LKQRRKSEGFNLAFLDIMSCGLGAVILIFMLVKHNVDNSVLEADLLTEDMQRLQQTEENLQQTLAALRNVSKSQQDEVAELKSKITQLKQDLTKKKSSIVKKTTQLAALKNDIKNAPVAKKNEVIEDDRGGEENYLMGMKVEGDRIAILIDSSASMTDEKLLDIIRRKAGSPAGKVRGPKWIRTKKVARWLLTRVPDSSRVTVIAFNNAAKTIGPGAWFDPRDKNAISATYQAINGIIPSGPTNLQLGLEAASKIKPTDIYIVTDGLPTTGESRYASLNPFADCSSLLGNSNNISGACRVKLFRQSTRESSPAGAVFNVILLPIEGDPDAANEYWDWASSTGGLLISPAANWP
jgi:hypothetical protein